MAWLTNWNYRKPITVSNAGSLLTDYQVPVAIDTSALISSGKMLSNCNDIRFTSSDGSTSLNYWIEYGINTASTKVWIKIPSIANGANTIYLYYNNPSASSESNGINTFIFFEHFQNGFAAWTRSSNCGNWNADNAYGGIDGYGLSFHNTNACFVGAWIYANRSIDMGTGGRRLYYSNSTEAVYFVTRSWTKLRISGTELWSSRGNASLGNYVQYYLDISSYSGIQTLELRAEQTSGDWPGQSIWDQLFICKYTSPAPTFSIGTEEIQSPANITATNMTLGPSESPCRVGTCTVTANVTWTNTGGTTGSFVPSIKIDGSAITPVYSSEQLASGANVTHAFAISDLSVGTHSICPYPN